MLRAAIILLLIFAPAASAQLPPGFPGSCDAPECAVIAGTGEEATDDETRGDGGPATAGAFDRVDGLDHSGGGHILVADGNDGRIRRIDPDGSIHTNRDEEVDDPDAVVSLGWAPADPIRGRHAFATLDDGLERHIVLDSTQQWQWQQSTVMDDIDASDLEASGAGYWVADPHGGTVWHVTFIPAPTNAWVESPVLEELPEPRGIGPLPGGGFLVATNEDCRILRHTDSGTVVLAGMGFCAGRENGGNGDGGRADQAFLGFPTDVEATPDGGFVMIERDRLRRVDPDGKLSTVFVTGLSVSPDFPPPEPSALEVLPDGDVLIGLDRRVLRFDTDYAPAPTPTPTPTATATATASPNPLPPPPGGPGPITPSKLTATLSKSSYKVVKGKKLALKFNAPSAGAFVVSVRKGKKLAKAFKGKAKAGTNTVKKKISLAPGRYGVTLTLKAGGETATDTAKLRVRAPRR